MMHRLAVIFFCFCVAAYAQAPFASEFKTIVRAEDARTYNNALQEFLTSPEAKLRARAALAAGRIGDEKAVPALVSLLENDTSTEVRAMAAFALGETESMLAADAILKAIYDKKAPGQVRSRVVEAAGKIVGANAAKGKSKMIENLGDAILDVLKEQAKPGTGQNREVVLAGLTAALRAHARTTTPGLSKEEIEAVDTGGAVAPFLKNRDARIRTDAGNTIARARYKKANDTLRAMLTDSDPTARANAARALGAAEDQGAADLLLDAALKDTDSRVRVSAIRSLGALKDAKAADKLIERGKALMGNYAVQKTANRWQKNEMLEIATTLGRLVPNTNNENAIKFVRELYIYTYYHSPEVAIAWAKIGPKNYVKDGGLRLVLDPHDTVYDWKFASSRALGLAELATSTDPEIKAEARRHLDGIFEFTRTDGRFIDIAIPDQLRALAAFKPDDLGATLREYLRHKDIFVRAAAADLLSDLPASKENVEALKTAFNKALIFDKDYNDAQLGILDALWKVDKKESAGTLLVALSAPDHLVRKKAMELLGDKDLQKDFPGIATSLENARVQGKDRPQPYSPAMGTKLGSIINKPADYTRAVSRRNGTVRAVFTTDKGAFTIELLPEDAPLTVDNFIKLARAGYFNGVLVHRVVPNFVMQDGDPRGDGNGGPGWSIRCEVNMVPYDRGAVGMALSGKDTGGSQWFVTHSPQPHLDGGYTVFGHVNDAGMKVVDNIARGDKIISVKIVEGAMQKPARK